MNLPLFIAQRYLVSRKKQNIINLISGIAAAGICVGTFALVVVLSVFNGFDGLIKSYFSILDPDLKITAVEGKLFEPGKFTDSLFHRIPGISGYACVIEENALLRHGNGQFIATMKGVPGNFAQITGIDSLIVAGSFLLESNGLPFAVPGQGVASFLGIDPGFSDPIHVYVPKKGLTPSLDPSRSLNYDYLFPAGVFALLEEVDAQMVFVPYSFAARLFDAGTRVSAIEVKVEMGVGVNKTAKLLQEAAGPSFRVLNQYRQHDTLYKTMKSEKWATYLILAFILVIASFNILGSLTMLILDKQEDIGILRSMGATPALIRRIFLFEGWLISIIGSVTGLVLGIVVCWLQIRFGLVSLPGEGSFVITAYPVELQAADLLFILSVVLLIGFLAAWYPVSLIARKRLQIHPAARE